MSLPPVVAFDHAYDIPPARLVTRLGGKGAYLAEMAALGLPVPPGFTITTDACVGVLDHGDLAVIEAEVDAAVAALERRTGRRLGDAASPLLVSVRSGAPTSMPGMMDTVLNIGANPATAAALARHGGSPAFGWDCYARLAAMFAASVLGVTADIAALAARAARDHADLAGRIAALDDALAGLAPLPHDPRAQLRAAIRAVIFSWNTDRARAYRRIEKIADRPCTAVTVQAMAFGNLSAQSGSGVAFTRDPATGAPGLVGDWLAHAQGEDVVAGTHHTGTIEDMARLLPEAVAALHRTATVLEHHLADMCDIEFTVEQGRLWLLQVRAGKRSPRAALRIAVDLANDPGFALDRRGAVERTARLLAKPPRETPPLHSLLPADRLHRGLGVSPGIGVGRACFDSDAVADMVAKGEPAVLLRPETSPSDVHGMAEAVAIVTATGGAMSHAAVVARGWGVPAVVGMAGLRFEGGRATIGGVDLRAGDWLSVDGSTGEVGLEKVSYDDAPIPEVAILGTWARELGIAIGDDRPAATAAGTVGDIAVDPATAVLTLLAIKGVVADAELGAASMTAGERLGPILDRLAESGDIESARRGRRLTTAGAARAAALFAAGHARLDVRAEGLLDGFDAVNRAFKTTMTAWQLRGEGVPNDHQDAEYDSDVIARFQAVHTEVDAWLGQLEMSLIALFRARLARAIGRVMAGDLPWLLSPRVDSYHSVWFELHEYLIRLAGRNRVDEAASGRAQ